MVLGIAKKKHSFKRVGKIALSNEKKSFNR